MIIPTITETTAEIKTTAAIRSLINRAYGCILGFKISTTLSSTVFVSSEIKTHIIIKSKITASQFFTLKTKTRPSTKNANRSSIRKFFSWTMAYLIPSNACLKLFKSSQFFVHINSFLSISFLAN